MKAVQSRKRILFAFSEVLREKDAVMAALLDENHKSWYSWQTKHLETALTAFREHKMLEDIEFYRNHPTFAGGSGQFAPVDFQVMRPYAIMDIVPERLQMAFVRSDIGTLCAFGDATGQKIEEICESAEFPWKEAFLLKRIHAHLNRELPEEEFEEREQDEPALQEA